MLVTGEREPLASAAEYQSGLPFGQTQFDDCFIRSGIPRGLVPGPNRRPKSGRTFRNFLRRRVSPSAWSITRRNREAICIEPLTCPPDPFRLSKLGVDAAPAHPPRPGELRGPRGDEGG